MEREHAPRTLDDLARFGNRAAKEQRPCLDARPETRLLVLAQQSPAANAGAIDPLLTTRGTPQPPYAALADYYRGIIRLDRNHVNLVQNVGQFDRVIPSSRGLSDGLISNLRYRMSLYVCQVALTVWRSDARLRITL